MALPELAVYVYEEPCPPHTRLAMQAENQIALRRIY